jgi:pimeloyl-ACP methyl ester carboxylesterase
MQFFFSDNVKIAFIDTEGEGEPILLIHGFASNHSVNWVNTLWTKTLTASGRRVIALDNRGHGQSQKLYEPAAYDPVLMAKDAENLLDHLGIEKADIMGYSMGGRIAAHFALHAPHKTRSLLIGGLGDRLVQGSLLPQGIAEAMEAPSLDILTDPMQRMFRAFADMTGSDRMALASCIRGARRTLSPLDVARITAPTLISVGTQDAVSGSARGLAVLMKNVAVLDIPDKDHNMAVGAKAHKEGVLAFLAGRE